MTLMVSLGAIYWHILSFTHYTFNMAAAYLNNVSQQVSSHISINILNTDNLIQYLC
jgi:hypothetical protein